MENYTCISSAHLCAWKIKPNPMHAKVKLGSNFVDRARLQNNCFILSKYTCTHEDDNRIEGYH